MGKKVPERRFVAMDHFCSAFVDKTTFFPCCKMFMSHPFKIIFTLHFKLPIPSGAPWSQFPQKLIGHLIYRPITTDEKRKNEHFFEEGNFKVM